MYWYIAPGIQGLKEKGERVKQVAGLATYNSNARGSVCRYLGQGPPPRRRRPPGGLRGCPGDMGPLASRRRYRRRRRRPLA